MLIPDANVTDRSFHNVTLLDMAEAVEPAVPVEDLSLLRRQWPISVLSGMSRKQTDLEQLCYACKQRFCGARTGCCPYCGTNIKDDMAQHVASFHLDLTQLRQCPVAWCTQWKGTPYDCIDQILKKHSVPDSVKAASLGRWFPFWIVIGATWHKALKPPVSGVSTNVELFRENGSSLIHNYRVFGRSAAHTSLRGTFMTKLWELTVRAVDEAKWEASRVPNQAPRLPLSSDSPAPLYRSIRPQGSDDDSPA